MTIIFLTLTLSVYFKFTIFVSYFFNNFSKDNDSSKTYFELNLDPPECLKNVSLIASKNYYRGLILISIFCEMNFYFVIQPGIYNFYT